MHKLILARKKRENLEKTLLGLIENYRAHSYRSIVLVENLRWALVRGSVLDNSAEPLTEEELYNYKYHIYKGYTQIAGIFFSDLLHTYKDTKKIKSLMLDNIHKLYGSNETASKNDNLDIMLHEAENKIKTLNKSIKVYNKYADDINMASKYFKSTKYCIKATEKLGLLVDEVQTLYPYYVQLLSDEYLEQKVQYFMSELYFDMEVEPKLKGVYRLDGHYKETWGSKYSVSDLNILRQYLQEKRGTEVSMYELKYFMALAYTDSKQNN